MSRVFRLLAVIAVALLVCVNFVGTQTASAADTSTFRVIDPLAYRAAAMLSPASERSLSGSASLLWIPLVGLDPNAQPVPTGLATSWDVAKDNMSVTLHLRKDAKFSDGTPITAKEAAWTLDYQIMTGHKSIYGQHDFFPSKRDFAAIKGAQGVFDGKVPSDEFDAASVEGVMVVDDYTLQIDLTQPSFYILNSLADAKVAKPDSVKAGKGKKYAEDAYWTTEPGTVFSGPWMLSSFKSGSGMTLVPNPNWFGPAPKIKTIQVQFVQDLNAAVAAFENKEVDWVNFQMTPIDVANLQGSAYLKSSLVAYPSLSVNQLFVTPFKPLDDVNVRRAISMAIDRQALVNVLGGGSDNKAYQVVSAHFAPANKFCAEQFATVKPMPFDVAGAKAELAKSPQAANVELNMQLGMFGMPLSQDLIISQVVQKMLADNLGLKVTIHQDPIPDFNKPPFATHLWPNEQGDHFVDQLVFMNNLASLNTSDPLPDESKMGMVTLPRIPALADLMKQAAATTDVTSRCQLLAKAQQVWVDQVFTLDLFTYNAYFLVAPTVKNYVVGNFGGALMMEPGMESIAIAAQ